MKITKKSFQAFFTRASFAGLLLGSIAAAQAQTNGTLATQTNTNWSTAPWVPGPYPDGGGVATFNTVTNVIVGTVPPAATITLDVPVTLSGINFNSPFNYTIAGTATNNITLASTGATINAILSPVNTLSLFQFGHLISAPITGGGAFGLTKTGTGVVSLTGANTYTGGTHINGGTLALTTASDAALGATGAGNDVSMNGGNLLVYNSVAATVMTTGRNFALAAGGGTFQLFNGLTINGNVTGTGALTKTLSGTLTLTGANTYTGATTVTAGGLVLSGNGTINQSSGLDLSGALTLTNTGTNNSDRLSDTATITSRGSTISMTGSAVGPTAEVAGPLVLANGVNSITVTPDATQAASLTFASITRQNQSSLFVRGTGLGNAAGAGVAQIASTASPGTLIGGGTATGTTISILPYAVGNVSATATIGSSFVTRDAATGQLRPLNLTTEYSALASGAASVENTKVTAATAITAPTTVNSVLVTGTGSLLSGTGGLTITSGALMYSPAATTVGTISANINFGSAEGIISSTAGSANSLTTGLTVSGVVSGTGGVTLNSVIGSNIALTGANTYTGTTTILGGLTPVSGTIAADGVTAGPFGLSTSAILFNGSAINLGGFSATAATTFNRNITLAGVPNASASFVTNGAYAFNVNGNVDIAANTRLLTYNVSGGTAATGFIFNGVLSGGGVLTDNTATSFTTLNGPNTYSGGTNISLATYQVGSDSTATTGPFGTGPINFSNAGGIRSKDTTAHIISNDILVGSTATFSGTGALTFTGAVNLNGVQTLSITNSALTTFSGVISNGALTKTGTGALALNSTTGNTYTGGTVLGNNIGTLYVNNASGSGTGTGTVSIGATSATTYSALAGNFTISGATSIGGRLSPGNGTGLTAATAGQGSIGIANFGGNLTLSSTTTSSLFLEAASNVSRDQINVGGTFTLAGTVNIATIGGYAFQPGDVVDFVDWGTLVVTGTPTFNTTGAAVAPGYALDTSFFTTDGTIRVTVVPEPGTWAAIVAGFGLLGGLQFVRRRNRRA